MLIAVADHLGEAVVAADQIGDLIVAGFDSLAVFMQDFTAFERGFAA